MSTLHIKPSYGVIVARCQVHELHKGHLALFSEVKARHNRVIVFLGQKPIGPTYKNPLDFETREAMIKAKFPEFKVLPLNDCLEDSAWSKDLDKKIREIVDYGDVTLYGGRDSFAPHYSGSYPVIELSLPLDLRDSGTAIRSKLTNTVMESADFRAGVIYAMTNLRPRVIPCVDIVITYDDKKIIKTESGPLNRSKPVVLLGRKPGESLWRFVGGHAEPGTDTFEQDARNEVMEESGLGLSDLKYIGSAKIDDWRWSDEPDKIKTLVFLGTAESMAAKAGDDIEQVTWAELYTLNPMSLVRAHQPIFKILAKHFRIGDEVNGNPVSN